jgi:general stress protein 26
VVFAELESLSKIVFFTREDRTKYKNIKNDSRVSMYIDSREKWARDPSSIEGVTLLGVAWQIKPGDEFNELRDLYLKKNPHMTFFVNDPNSIMFRINVESYKYVVNFDESYDLKL